MRPEIIVFFVILGIFLFLKFRKGSLPGFSSLPKINALGTVGKWWVQKDDEGKKFLWYVLVIILAYGAMYVAPEGDELIVRCAVALIGLHLIWTFVTAGKISTFTWTIVGGMLGYFVLAGFYPVESVKIKTASIKLMGDGVSWTADTLSNIANNTPHQAPVATAPAVATAPVSAPKTKPVVVNTTIVIPPYGSIEVTRPMGYYLSEVVCSDSAFFNIRNAETGEMVGGTKDCSKKIKGEVLPADYRIIFFKKDQNSPGEAEAMVSWTRRS